MSEQQRYMGLKFDPDAMIRLLGVQLYDTPLAMLRENVQNAYDAILERMGADPSFSAGAIHIEISDGCISVIDNGIGMDDRNLQDNYWTAGNSSKNTDSARQAGVVGHFGIGALANFGVCETLEVDTLKLGHQVRYHCLAERAKLDGKQIRLDESTDTSRYYGTRVTVTLREGISISLSQAGEYLQPYVGHIRIPVYLNDKRIQQSEISLTPGRTNIKSLHSHYDQDGVAFDCDLQFSNYQPLKPELLIRNITIYGAAVPGTLLLNTSNNELFGLSNGFGLSHIQIRTAFNFGGLADFKSLQPTAGREAVSRESTAMVQNIVNHAERFWAETISAYEVADGYRDFMAYADRHFSTTLVRQIRIQEGGSQNVTIPLGQVLANGDYAFYRGADPQMLKSILSSGKHILIPSADALRKRIQLRYLEALRIEERRDKIEILKIYTREEIGSDAYMFLDDVRRTIEDDYVLQNVSVCFADITLGVNILVEPNRQGSFTVNIARKNPEACNLIENQEKYDLYLRLVKDFVRVVLYNHFIDFIPKDQKERASYINEAMERKREEMVYDYSDISELREALNKMDRGEMTSDEFFQVAKKTREGKQEQTVKSDEVGSVESVVKTANQFFAGRSQPSVRSLNNDSQHFEYVPQPPILELSETTSKKILKTSEQLDTIHFHRMFLSLSPKFNYSYRSFFLYPHLTKVIWSTHRIIYIFTDQLGKMSLYYEMELEKQLEEKNTGGQNLISTTIITDGALFVPIPSQLYDYFTLHEGHSLKFKVHFDKSVG